MEISEIMFKLSGDGLLVNFWFDTCGLCNRHYDIRKWDINIPKAFESIWLENSNLKVFGCGHHYHEKCLQKWNVENGPWKDTDELELICPVCFNELKVEDSKST